MQLNTGLGPIPSLGMLADREEARLPVDELLSMAGRGGDARALDSTTEVTPGEGGWALSR